LAHSLRLQISDLRSNLVKETCLALHAIVEQIGAPLEPLVAAILPALVKNSYVKGIKAISVSSHEATLALLGAAPSPAAFAVLLTALRDEHFQARRASVDYIRHMLSTDAAERVVPVDKVSPLLAETKLLIADADSTVRASASKLFWDLHAKHPAQATELLSRLDPSRQKMLKRNKPSA